MKHQALIFVFTVFLGATAPAKALAAGAAGSVANGIVNHNNPEWDSRVQEEGRERSLSAAENSANTGAAVAGATGSALAAAGTGYILAGDLPTGASLLAMAGMEFAQMAASMSAGNQNRGMKEILTKNYNEPNTAQILADENKSDSFQPKLPANLENYLNKIGVDTETFQKDLFSGRLGDQNSVLEALGKNPNAMKATDLENGLAKAQGEFDKIASEQANSFLGNQGNGQAPSKAVASAPHSLKEINPEAVDKNRNLDERKANRKLTNSSDFSSEVFAQSGIPNMFGLPADTFSTPEKQLLVEAYLKEQGLVQTRPGLNIFQVAQNNYRAFGKAKGKGTTGKIRMARSN